MHVCRQPRKNDKATRIVWQIHTVIPISEHQDGSVTCYKRVKSVFDISCCNCLQFSNDGLPPIDSQSDMSMSSAWVKCRP
jgi:hypothetical protein